MKTDRPRRLPADIAKGFMESKVLFAALELGVFEKLEEGPKEAPQLARDLELPLRSVRALLRALVALSLVDYEGGRYRNAPLTRRQLVRGAPHDIVDFLLLQFDLFFYERFGELAEALRQGGPLGSEREGQSLYETIAESPEHAELLVRSLASSSRQLARLLSRRELFADRRSLLVVRDGPAAYAVEVCRAAKNLKAAVIDLPHLCRAGTRAAAEAGLSGRLKAVPVSSLDEEWRCPWEPPDDRPDALLLPFLLSARGPEKTRQYLRRAHDLLRPGGRLVTLEYAVAEDGASTTAGALHGMSLFLWTEQGEALPPPATLAMLKEAGFTVLRAEVLIPGLAYAAIGERW